MSHKPLVLTSVSPDAENTYDARIASVGDNPTWFSSSNEEDPEWDAWLKEHRMQWFKLVVGYCVPPGLIFGYSIVKTVMVGRWWNTSADEPYEPPPNSEIYTVYTGIPAILKSHMAFAVPMLLTIIVQLVLAFLGVIKKNEKCMTYHRLFGIVPLAIIFLCVGLGTLALGLCDINPKRGAETIFFCTIGVGIFLCVITGVKYVSKGFVGLHMQYMTIGVCFVFSPGFNRITTVLVRFLRERQTEGYDQLCWKVHLWGQQGYLYTWSFLLGTGWLMGLWLLPFSPARAPFFRKWSVGFWYTVILGMILIACLYQSIFQWNTIHSLINPLDCSPEHLDNYKTFSRAMRARNLFSPEKAYGLCTPDSNELLTGVPRTVVQTSPCAWNVYQAGGPYKIPLQGTDADIEDTCGK